MYKQLQVRYKNVEVAQCLLHTEAFTLPCRSKKKSEESNFRLILYTASMSRNSQNQINAGLISRAAMTARHVPRVTPMQTMQCVSLDTGICTVDDWATSII